MRFLERERAALTKLLPGLDDGLRALPLMTLESPGSPGIGLFRECGGPGLLAPTALQGRGATALEAVRVQRALGSRTPTRLATSSESWAIRRGSAASPSAVSTAPGTAEAAPPATCPNAASGFAPPPGSVARGFGAAPVSAAKGLGLTVRSMSPGNPFNARYGFPGAIHSAA